MGAGRATVALALLATLFLAAALSTPWWFFHYSERNDETAHCWIDGTCRSSEYEAKMNGRAQKFYLIAEILMIVSILPFLVWLHFILFMAGIHHYIRGAKAIQFISGLLATLLMLAAVIVFAIGMTKYTVGNFVYFGSTAPWAHTGAVPYDANCIGSGAAAPTPLTPAPTVAGGSILSQSSVASSVPAEYITREVDDPYGTIRLPNGGDVRWGLHAGWYLALLTAALTLLGTLLGLAMRNHPKDEYVVPRTRTAA
jgi:hypothetical protein